MYIDDFRAANEFSKSLGLPGIVIPPIKAYSYIQDPDFFPTLANFLTINEPHELVANCNVVSQVVCEAISRMSDCTAYLTIGDITFDGKPFFDVNADYIKGAIAGGKSSLAAQKYRHHAWVTLDTMEIIDFTLNTSMALLSKDLSPPMRYKLLGGVLSGYADEITDGMRYCPILVGEEFYTTYDSTYPLLKSIYLNGLNTKSITQSVITRIDS